MSLLDESLAISSELGMRPLTAYQGAIELTLTLIAWSSTKSRPAVCQLSIAESLIQIQKMWLCRKTISPTTFLPVHLGLMILLSWNSAKYLKLYLRS
jgi:hypothetical protein